MQINSVCQSLKCRIIFITEDLEAKADSKLGDNDE